MLRFCFILIALSSGNFLTGTAQSFTRVAGVPWSTGSSHGASWGDYDNDGWLDLFVVYHATESDLLLRNNGDGTFTKITGIPPVQDRAHTYAATWADYDNDAHLDLFVSNYGRDFLYHALGNGQFESVTNGLFAEESAESNAGAWADYDQDGYLDLFVANWKLATNALYHNLGDGRFEEVRTGPLVTEPSESIGCAWADFDNDGDPDLFVANGSRSQPADNFLYRNLGKGNFEKVLAGTIGHDGGFSYGCAWADYDNDGDLDLFVCNYGEPNFFYENLGNGSFTRLLESGLTAAVGNSYTCAWGDYDNDGNLDLFVANLGGGNFLYHNNGDKTFSRVLTGDVATDSGASTGCAWGDFNNDGYLDLVVSNHGGPNFLYRNEGGSNHWLTIQCIGRGSNRSGIGAKVRVLATIRGKEVWQFREISGGDGVSGHTLLAEFGLGDAAIVQRIRIEWPSGAIQTIPNIPSNQFVTITEPLQIHSFQMLSEDRWRLSLVGSSARTFSVQASSNLHAWSEIAALSRINGTIEFTDPQAKTSPQRFYRVVEALEF